MTNPITFKLETCKSNTDVVRGTFAGSYRKVAIAGVMRGLHTELVLEHDLHDAVWASITLWHANGRGGIVSPIAYRRAVEAVVLALASK